MKNIFPALTVAFLLGFNGIKGQQIIYNVNPPSCLSCCDGSFTMTVTYCTNFIYMSTPSLNLATSSPTQRIFTNVCGGTYTIDIIGSPICGPYVKEYFTMPLTTGVPSIGFDQVVSSVFPNPAQDFVNFRIDLPANREVSIRINDVAGSLVKEMNLTSSTTVLNVSNYKNGFYFVNVICDGRIIGTKRLIVTK